MTPGLLLLTVAVVAQNQDNSMIKFGPFSFQPSLVVQNIGRDPNVFNSATNPQSDFTMTVTPKMNVIFQVRDAKTTFTETTDYVYFQRFASERGVNESYAVREDLPLGILQPFASFSTASSKSRINNEVDVRARHTNTAYDAGTGITVFTRTHVSVRAYRAEATFDPGASFRGENLAQAFDSVTRGLDTSIGVSLTPLTSFAVVVTDEQQRFDLTPQRNSDTFRVMPTLTFSPLGLLNGNAAFGWRRFTPKDPTVPAFRGFVAQVGAGITVLDRHRLSVSYVRDLTYSYDLTSVYFIQNSVGGGWSYAIGRGFDMQLGATRNLMHYHQTSAGVAADDTYTSYDASFGYRITPRLRASVNGSFQSRSSGLAADRDYNSNRVFGTVTWGG